MNEFIVWDAKEKVFPSDTYRFVRDTSGHLYVRTKSAMLEHQNVENRYFAFDDIGKTDINGKKMYSQSSIIKVHDIKSRFYNDICKIKYCKRTCAYLLYSIDLEDDHSEPIKADYLNRYYEIVGTLQENKLSEFKT